MIDREKLRELGRIQNQPEVWGPCEFDIMRKSLPALLDEITRLEGELEKERGKVCVWTEDDNGDYDTGCGQMWSFTCDGPDENGANYCHACGGKLELRAAIKGG